MPCWNGILDGDYLMDKVCNDGLDVYHIRAAPLQGRQLIILGSGAYISLLPCEMAPRKMCWKEVSSAVLEDAQSCRLQTFGRSSAQIEVEGIESEQVLSRMTSRSQA